jgi:hypothetical protein
MTALCGGGTSAPKVLPELAATYSAGRLAQLLVAAGVGELSAWLPLVGLIPVVYSAFCASDPPTMVALSQAESDALANNTIGTDFFNGLGKFKDVLLNLIWLDACQCTSGTLAPPSVPAINANTPVYVPPTAQLAPPCFDSAPFSHPLISTGTHTIGGLNTTATPGLVPTAYVVRLTSVVGTPPGTTLTITGEADHGSTVDATASVSLAPGGVATLVVPFNFALSTYTILRSVAVSGTGAEVVTTQEQWYCGASPSVAQTPCCPPDPATQAYLDLIFKAVTLLQRQLAPFGYIASTAHAGLTGAGSFGISGLIGAKVLLTTVPSQLGASGTSPAELFDAGWITFGTTDGYPASFRVEHNPELLLPSRMGAYTAIAYDLHPGVVATITELLREP